MKKILVLCFTITFLFSCSGDNGNDADISSDIIIGSWKMISQKINGLETADNCRKQTVFIFESSRVLRQMFYRTENSICIGDSEVISSWFNLGNSSYRINGSSGSRVAVDFVFTEADTKFTTTETSSNSDTTVTVFQKF
jgi:hypothetical protein